MDFKKYLQNSGTFLHSLCPRDILSWGHTLDSEKPPQSMDCPDTGQTPQQFVCGPVNIQKTSILIHASFKKYLPFLKSMQLSVCVCVIDCVYLCFCAAIAFRPFPIKSPSAVHRALTAKWTDGNNHVQLLHRMVNVNHECHIQVLSTYRM